MIPFFDYLYLSFIDLFSNDKDKAPEFEASCFMSGFQALNVLSLIMLYGIAVNGDTKVNITKGIVIVILMFWFVFNYVRYIRIKRFYWDEIKIRWEQKSNKSQKTYRNFQIGYIVISILIFGILIYYFASDTSK